MALQLTGLASRCPVAGLAAVLLAIALSACGGGSSPLKQPVAAPLITAQPASTSVASGTHATFSVSASGTGPFGYQWSRNGIVLPGATAATYVQQNTQASDSAAVMRVEVRNSGGAVGSQAAMLSLNSPGIYQFAGPVIGTGELTSTQANSGSTDGLGQEARFQGPAGLALDPAGNLYVADRSAHTLRKITPAGLSSTIAGKPFVLGRANGRGVQASFTIPERVAASSDGTVYLNEMALETTYPIRKVSPDGTVTTLVLPLDPYETNADGSPAAVSVNSFTVDAADNLIVSTEAHMQGKCRPPLTGLCPGVFTRTAVRRLSPAGAVSTVATSESLQASGQRGVLLGPVAVDAAGNVYATNLYSILKVSPAGVITPIAGSLSLSGSLDGTGSEARFTWIRHMTVDPEGNLFILDGTWGPDQKIRKITAAGVVTTVAGGQAGGTTLIGNLPGTLEYIDGIVAGKNGVLYVSCQFGILKIILR